MKVCLRATYALAAAAGLLAISSPSPANADDSGFAPWMIGPFTKVTDANPVVKPAPDVAFDDPMSGKSVFWERDHTFNPAAVVRDNKVYLLYRAEDDSGEGIGAHTSRLGLAVSSDGIHFQPSAAPVLYPANDDQKDYDWTGGCEDPRIVETEDGGYVLTYTSWNHKTARLCTATSRNLTTWQKHGPALAKANGGKFVDTWCKSGAIVTKRKGDHLIATKIHGKYWMFFGEGTVYTATSDNLIDWQPTLDSEGKWQPLLAPRAGLFDSSLAESGPPAVLTSRGIVFIYNGRNGGSNRDPNLQDGVYSGAEALIDPDDPTKLRERPAGYVLTPEAAYERTGQYAAGTTFVEGLVHFHKRWFLYYGSADSFVAVATARG